MVFCDVATLDFAVNLNCAWQLKQFRTLMLCPDHLGIHTRAVRRPCRDAAHICTRAISRPCWGGAQAIRIRPFPRPYWDAAHPQNNIWLDPDRMLVWGIDWALINKNSIPAFISGGWTLIGVHSPLHDPLVKLASPQLIPAPNSGGWTLIGGSSTPDSGVDHP